MLPIQNSLLDLIDLLENKKITSEELIEQSISLANKYKKFNFYSDLFISNKNENKGELFGIPFMIKDNISTKGIKTTGSSNILKNYIPPYNATVVDKLINAGAIMIGKNTMDELAFGGTGAHANTGFVYNPYDPSLTTLSGGSSSGSAVAVALGVVPFSIGSDTGDSIRKPASLCGIVGLKPTFGRISKYGLFPFSPPMDHVGYFTRNIEDSAYLLSILAGHDENDPTSSLTEVPNYHKNINPNINKLKIAVVKEIFNSVKEEKIVEDFNAAIKLFKDNGAIVDFVSVDINLIRSVLPVYKIISSSDASSVSANLNGVGFTNREQGNNLEEIITNSRTVGLRFEAKKRILFGSYCLMKENYKETYLKASKIRRLIIEQYNEVFKNYDVIVVPAAANTAKTLKTKTDDTSDELVIGENHLGIANLGGFPSLTMPLGFLDNMPFGINFTSKIFNEQVLFNLGVFLENKLPYKNLIVRSEQDEV